MDFNKVLSGLTNSGVLGGVAGGAVAGAVMSNKKARKHASTLLQVGGVAALGTLAWKAYKGYKDKQPPETVTERAPAQWGDLNERGFVIDETDTDVGSRGVILVKAMIAAACADGHLDSEERERIMQRIEALSLQPDEYALIMDALQQPPTLAQVCEHVSCPELAAEVYLCSALAVDRKRTEARVYLGALAHKLKLPAALATQIEQDLVALTPGEKAVRAVA
ncbi:MAG: tellurite resistance TerB family protein [Pseudomonadota bacterium]